MGENLEQVILDEDLLQEIEDSMDETPEPISEEIRKAYVLFRAVKEFMRWKNPQTQKRKFKQIKSELEPVGLFLADHGLDPECRILSETYNSALLWLSHVGARYYDEADLYKPALNEKMKDLYYGYGLWELNRRTEKLLFEHSHI